MKKIPFTISIILFSFTAFSQVSQSPSLLNIGSAIPELAPIPHNLLVGLPNANEVGRLQKAINSPDIFFKNNSNITKALIRANLTGLAEGLHFSVEGGRKFSFENANTGANIVTIDHSEFNSQTELQVMQGMEVVGPIQLNGTYGTAGQIFTSRGNGLSPVWATTHDDPKLGINAFIDYSMNIANNTSQQLTNFTVNTEDNPSYLLDSFDASTGYFTARTTGLYHFDLNISWFNTTANKADIEIYLLRNGSFQKSMKKDFGRNGTAETFYNEIHLSQNIYLTENDNVNFLISQLNSDNLSLTISDKKIKLGIYQVYFNN